MDSNAKQDPKLSSRGAKKLPKMLKIKANDTMLRKSACIGERPAYNAHPSAAMSG
ncbi:hypothetical protein PU634_06395 [Oceanimonas pelagia]|uniref:Uncharacterized protein n=1 Tax=Oceanimonas pelagia TaxID=3028314 RepID=A0AA50KQV5_9GAMM|nr:hypothetical protein [Oceanimonas pelagia]WMC11989.1 hypothetical protein PU634_06395 [Oceanimonas pelagia]